jgi:DNA polymerase-3 subunit chi
MTDIQFYYLASPLDRVLPKLLEKSLQSGFRVLVKCASGEQAEALNGLLWTYDPDSFIPHGTAKDGHSALQPVYLSAENDNPNASDLVIVTDGSQLEPAAEIKRVLDITDGNDAAAIAQAQQRLADYRAKGHAVSCVRQNASGGWEKLAA